MTHLLPTLRLPSKLRLHKDLDHLYSFLLTLPDFRRQTIEFTEDFVKFSARVMTVLDLAEGKLLENRRNIAIFVVMTGKIRRNESEFAPFYTFTEVSDIEEEEIVALEDSVLGIVYKTDYLDIVNQLKSQRITELRAFLHGIPVFSRLSRSRVLQLIDLLRPISFYRKQVVYRAHTPSHSVFIVKTGEFALLQELKTQSKEGKSEKKEYEVALIGAGELAGEAEIVLGREYAQSCVCSSSTGVMLQINTWV